jgi:hypothetical protein
MDAALFLVAASAVSTALARVARALDPELNRGRVAIVEQTLTTTTPEVVVPKDISAIEHFPVPHLRDDFGESVFKR